MVTVVTVTVCRGQRLGLQGKNYRGTGRKAAPFHRLRLRKQSIAYTQTIDCLYANSNVKIYSDKTIITFLSFFFVSSELFTIFAPDFNCPLVWVEQSRDIMEMPRAAVHRSFHHSTVHFQAGRKDVF